MEWVSLKFGRSAAKAAGFRSSGCRSSGFRTSSRFRTSTHIRPGDADSEIPADSGQIQEGQIQDTHPFDPEIRIRKIRIRTPIHSTDAPRSKDSPSDPGHPSFRRRTVADPGHPSSPATTGKGAAGSSDPKVGVLNSILNSIVLNPMNLKHGCPELRSQKSMGVLGLGLMDGCVPDGAEVDGCPGLGSDGAEFDGCPGSCWVLGSMGVLGWVRWGGLGADGAEVDGCPGVVMGVLG